MHDLDELMRVALRCARRAAAVHALRPTDLEADPKSSPTDLVTQVDRDAETVLVEAILEARPSDGILGEEGTERSGDSGVEWILDPLDGTTNFVFGYPAHAVSVGVLVEGRRALGVVIDTARQRTYAGIVGRGSTCDGKAISLGRQRDAGLALLGTGFLPNAAVRAEQGKLLAQLLPRFRDLRRSGSAAIDLALVSCGVLDIYYEFGLGPWDLAGGAAIVEAAGGVVLELSAIGLPEPLAIAGNATLVAQLRQMLVEAGVTPGGGGDYKRRAQ